MAPVKKLLMVIYKKADLPWLRALTTLRLNISRNIQYSIISILFSFGSVAVFGIIFLVAFFMHKKTKEWFPSEKDHKDAVKNINNDNTPDAKVEPEFAKKQQPVNANSQLPQDAIKKQSQNNLNPGGNKNLQDFQQKSQSNINEEENPPVELSKKSTENSSLVGDNKDPENSNVEDVKDTKGATDEKNTNKDDNDVIQDNNKNQNKEFLNLQNYRNKSVGKTFQKI